MIFLLFSFFGADYQNLVKDAKNFGLGGVSSSIPGTPFDNPAISSLEKTFLGIDVGYIFSGFSTLFTIKGALNRNNSGFGFLLFNNVITDIPDTRNALVDFNGNGELDDGEYLDSNKIVYKNAFQNILIFNISRNFKNIYYGLNMKLFYENLMGERGIGGGFDLGVIFRSDHFRFGLTLRDITSSLILWKNTEDRINPSLIFGSSFRIKKNIFSIMPCFDFVFDDIGFTSFLGLCISYRDMLEILSGIKKGGISFGSGFYFKEYRFHYGIMINYEESFPLTHRITLSKSFDK